MSATFKPGDRVCRWHQTFATQWDPIPGTVVSIGAVMATVDWDHGTTSRVKIDNLEAWSEPRED